MPYTVVSFHAHPDDEALLTAGTLARAAAEGHRVVLVTATDGAAGLAAEQAHRGEGGLAARRIQELRAAAAAIGCRDVRFLGYADSGMDGAGGGPGRGFAGADVEDAAARLADILRQTGADVLTTYDRAGGYGHPDHVQVHRVGVRAAELASTPVVLEATVDRLALTRALRILSRSGVLKRLGVAGDEWSPERFAHAYADPGAITHRVNVRRYAGAKRAAMAAHASQGTSDEGVRTLAVFLRLPPFVFGRVFGHEWFVERGRAAGGPPLDDIFTSLRTVSAIREPRTAGPA